MASELDIELGYPPAPAADSSQPSAAGRWVGLLAPEEEELVQAIRSGLTRVATAAAAGHVNASPNTTAAALDGIELVMRGELVAGREERLAALLPGSVFLVTLSAIGHEDALQLARRTEKLLE